MDNISAVSILILLSLLLFFIREVIAYTSMNENKKKKNNKFKSKTKPKTKPKRGVHLLGMITTFLVMICVAFSTFGISYESKFLITTTVILAVVFYISLGWQTLFKVKR